MIKAKEALEISNKILNPKTEEVLAEIEKTVIEAAEKGEIRIEFSVKDKKVNEEMLKDELRKAGFSADIGAAKICIVKWDKR